MDETKAATKEEVKLRSDLEALPDRLKTLEIDDRGYPVPWFVAYKDGKPEFRAMDNQKWIAAVNRHLCWVCGGKMGARFTFVAGPMCGINRTSSEPPSHYECAVWSCRNCPFLSKPQMVRREDELTEEIRDNCAGFMIKRNPGVAMLWTTRSFDVFKTATGPLIQLGEPERVEWLCQGRQATRAEVDASIDSGLPALETMARQEKGGLEFLARAQKRFEKWLPA